MCGALPPTLFDFLCIGTWIMVARIQAIRYIGVSVCLSVSHGVPEWTSGVKIVNFGYPRDLENRAKT